MKKIFVWLLILAMLFTVGCGKKEKNGVELLDGDSNDIISDIGEADDDANNQAPADDTPTPDPDSEPFDIRRFPMPYDFGDNTLVARDEGELRTLRWAQAAAREAALNKGYIPCEIEVTSIDSLNLGMASQYTEMVEMYRVSYVMSYNFMMYGEVEGYEATGRGYVPDDPSTEALLVLYFNEYKGQYFTVMAGCFSEADAQEAALSVAGGDPLEPYRILAGEAMAEAKNIVEGSINAGYGPEQWYNYQLHNEEICLRIIGTETLFGPGSLDKLDSLGIGYREETYYQPGHGLYDAWMGFSYPTLSGTSYFTGFSGSMVLLAVDTNNPEIETPRGIHVGSTRQDVLLKYPEIEYGIVPNMEHLGDDCYYYCPSASDYSYGEEERQYYGPTLVFEMEGEEVGCIYAYTMMD